jgi:ABC-type nickel/cobalt efflux system permease component RcnA
MITVPRWIAWWGAGLVIALTVGLAVTAVAVAELTVRAASTHSDLCQFQAEVRMVHRQARMVVTGCGK